MVWIRMQDVVSGLYAWHILCPLSHGCDVAFYVCDKGCGQWTAGGSADVVS
jgi:hypothetical protein